jgi:hypothetical protein
LEGNKRALSAIINTIPDHKLYLIKDLDYAADAWKALKNKYKPVNAHTIVQTKQDLMSTRCASHDLVDVEHWVVWMIGKKQVLHNADPNAMGDKEFVRHIVTLMPQMGRWMYMANLLAMAMLKNELDGQKFTSAAVISMICEQMKMNDRVAQEEVVMNVNVGQKRPCEDACYTNSQSANQSSKRFHHEYNGLSLHSSYQRELILQYPVPSSQAQQHQGHSQMLHCTNTYCRRPNGHLACARQANIHLGGMVPGISTSTQPNI